MLLDVAAVAVFLILGNIVFWHFDSMLPLWRRALKVSVTLGATAVISHYFGRTGVLIAFALAMIPVIYIHGIWLPRHGINGWTGEPRDKYYALRSERKTNVPSFWSRYTRPRQ